jgi:hypothetical protein
MKTFINQISREGVMERDKPSLKPYFNLKSGFA